MVFADLVHCCWTVEYDDKSVMKTRKKMYKLYAVPERPGRRPLPPPADDLPAPSLPPRPGGKSLHKTAPPPQETHSSDEFDSENSSEPGEIYDDCEEHQPPQPILPQRPLGRPQVIAPPVEEFYDDCNEEKQEQEVYDDFEEEKQEKQLPKRPATQLPPIPLPPEESYDDLENIGPVVVHPIKSAHRTLPPPPPSSIQTDRGRVKKVETKKPSLPELPNEVYEDPEMENARKDSLTRLEVASEERSSSLSPVRSLGHRDLSPQSSSRGPTINHHSPARTNVSPKGTLERHLPPVPVSKEGNTRARGLDHPLLPPVNRPLANATNRTDMAESSPVIVNLGHPKKGVLPPVPPLSEKPLRPDLHPKVPRGLIHGANLSENEEDEMLETEEQDLDHDDFPPPPSPISGRKQAIPQPPPPPLPPIPSFLSSEAQDIYEVSPDIDDDTPSTPPLPPKSDVKPVKPSPKVPNMPAGGFLVDQSQINALKNKLKKVSVPDIPKITSREPKEYGDNNSISELQRKFQEKTKISDTPDKRALRVQMNSPQDLNTHPVASPSSSASSCLTNMSGSSSFLQHDLESPRLPPRQANLTSPLSMTNPDKTSSSAETSSPPVHKNNASMPLPPLPSVTKIPSAVPPPVSKPEYTDDNPDEIYDEASSTDLLDRFEWYHGPIDRKEGEARVKSIGKDGTYLVRISTKNAKFPYTLVVLLKGHASNLHIRFRNDKKYALGDEKDDELAFSDIPEMISHHKKHHVLLMGNIKSQVTLQQTPPKK